MQWRGSTCKLINVKVSMDHRPGRQVAQYTEKQRPVHLRSRKFASSPWLGGSRRKTSDSTLPVGLSKLGSQTWEGVRSTGLELHNPPEITKSHSNLMGSRRGATLTWSLLSSCTGRQGSCSSWPCDQEVHTCSTQENWSSPGR